MQGCHNNGFAARVLGRLEFDALSDAITQLVARHPMLRTCYRERDGEPEQCVRAAAPVSVTEHVVGSEDIALLAHRVASDFVKPFDLARPALIRAALYRINAAEAVLALTFDHIAGDGWSYWQLIDELGVLLQGALPVAAKNAPHKTYRDFVEWERSWLESEKGEAQWGYWQKQLEGTLPVLQLHTDHPRSSHVAQCQLRHSIELSASLTQKLRTLSAAQSSTLFSTLLAAYAMLLHRHSGQDDIIIGVPMPGRTDAVWDKIVGDFVNPVALRIQFEKGATVSQVLQFVRRTAMRGLAHQDYPFSRLVERLQPDRASRDHPLYQTTFTFQKARHGRATARLMTVCNSVAKVSWGGFELEGFSAQQSGMGAYVSLALETLELEAGIRCDFKYAPELYDAASMARMAGHFRRLLHLIVADPDKRLGALDILGASERHQLLVEWNNTAAECPRSTIQQMFEAQAARTPDTLALLYGDLQLTYADLNRHANQLAHYLRGQGVGPDVLVGICATRSLEMMVGLIGILKAGGAYMPLDPSYPPDRLAFMINDAKPMVLLTQQHLKPILGVYANKIKTLCLDTQSTELASFSGTNPKHTVDPANLAYVIYTSGSTGRPKGTCITHQAAINLLIALVNRVYKNIGNGKGLRVGVNASISFDASVQQWLLLLKGATLYLIPEQIRHDPQLLASMIGPWQLDVLDCTPAQLPLLLPTGDSVRLARNFLIGGEAIDPQMWKTLKDLNGQQFYNVYGPTEATVDTLICDIQAAGDVPVLGQPIDNTQLYLLDSDLNPVPIGVVGELHIGGEGLARGYLNRPELTAEKFIPNPFSNTPGARMFKSGDLARYLPDGSIEYLGRIDHQVKIRGFRIELDEIETALATLPGIRQAVVVAKEDRPGDKQLVGYLVGRTGEVMPDRAEVRGLLLQFLPDFMVPKHFVGLPSLPLTPNGKLDRKALPGPDLLQRGTEYLAPGTVTETTLAGIWSDVLKLDCIGSEDDFFELGGHSLLTTQVAARMREVFGVELPLRTLFEHPKLSALAAVLDAAQQGNLRSQVPELIVQPRPPRLPLSYAQERLWLLEHIESMGSAYNISGALRFTGLFDDQAFERSVAEIVRRHEPLRTRIEADDETIEQIIELPGRFALQRLDLSNLPVATRSDEATRVMNEVAEKSFDLAAGSLFRVTVLRLAPDEHVVVVVMHHIVSDGWSLGVLIRELGALYTAYTQGKSSPLPELSVQYADYALWQRTWLQGETLEHQVKYWKTKLSGMPADLTLPLDRPRPSVQSFRGAKLCFVLPKALTQQLVSLARAENATLFMLLLAGFQYILSRWSDQEDIVLGTPVAGRTNRHTEGLIGLFVNILVLRTDVSGTQSLRQLLARTKETSLQAYSHQDLPFERLVEEINPARDLSRPPIFQVMINSITADARPETLQLPGLVIESLSAGEVSARFEMMLRIREDGDSVTCFLEYATDLFDAATMERFAMHYCSLLEQAVSAPDQPLCEFSLLSDAERRLILEQWNKVTAAPELLSVPQMVRAQALRAPTATALEFEDGSVSYEALEVGSNRLARHLLAKGVVAGSPVGLIMQPAPVTPVALLGILKAGAICLPLDPGYSDEYLRELLVEGGATLALGTDGRATALVSANCPAIELVEQTEAIAALSGDHFNAQIGLDDASCLFTMWDARGHRTQIAMTHRGVSQQLTAMAECTKDELQHRALGFSPRVCDVLLPLVVGARLQLAVAAGQQQGTDVMFYGVTRQATPHLSAGGASLLGRALPGVHAYVLDQRLALVPPYVIGELYVDASSWAHDYAWHADLTAQDFVPSPFTAGARLYRTGVRARWRSDGYLEFVGRAQHAWINGHYVNLGEVEAALNAHSMVKEAVVMPREDAAGQVQLVGYVSLHAKVSAATSDVDWRDSLIEMLPPHLIPATVMVLEQLPRIQTGSIDWSALPSPDSPFNTYVAPQTALEQEMAAVWAEVLGVEKVGMEDNFFDLGGHSLLATIMLSRMHQAFGIELPLRTLFEAGSLRTFAAFVTQAQCPLAEGREDSFDYEVGTL